MLPRTLIERVVYMYIYLLIFYRYIYIYIHIYMSIYMCIYGERDTDTERRICQCIHATWAVSARTTASWRAAATLWSSRVLFAKASYRSSSCFCAAPGDLYQLSFKCGFAWSVYLRSNACNLCAMRVSGWEFTAPYLWARCVPLVGHSPSVCMCLRLCMHACV